MKIVVARYNEDLDWILDINENFIVYNKGKDLNHQIPEIKLPNIGREQYTFYYHIYHNYDNIDDHTAFIQGNPFYHISREEIIKELSPEDFKTIGTLKVAALPHAETFNLKNSIDKTVSFLNLKSFSWNYEFTAGGQFIASKKTIKKYPKSFYKKILQMWDSDWGKVFHAGSFMDSQDFIFEHLNSVIYS